MKRHLLFISITLFCAFIFSAAFGEIFVWTDEDGERHFSNIPPPDRTLEEMDIRGSWPVAEDLGAVTETSGSTLDLSGSGSTATKRFHLEEGLIRFEFTYTGEGNFIAELLDAQGDDVALIANEIGNTVGSKAVGIRRAGDHILNINADGSWKISINRDEKTIKAGKPSSTKDETQLRAEYSKAKQCAEIHARKIEIFDQLIPLTRQLTSLQVKELEERPKVSPEVSRSITSLKGQIDALNLQINILTAKSNDLGCKDIVAP